MMAEAIKPIGRIKTEPEDFIVQEIADGRAPHILKRTRITGATSRYTKFIFTKRGVESQKAYQEIADQLQVHRSQVTDYGMKDAAAVTVQIVVVEGQFTPAFYHRKMWLYQLGPADGPLKHGQHEGNRFSIVVRTEEVSPPPEATEFLNLFGPQRFGDGRVLIGKYLLEGNFTAALAEFEESMNWRDLEKIMNKGHTALEALKHPDFRGILKFRVQQWQSWMWNEVAKLSNQWRIPVWSPGVADMYAHLWDPDIDQLHPHMVQHAYPFTRKVKVQPGNPIVSKHPEGFKHEFTLPSGVYATVYLAHLYDLRDISREKHVMRPN